MKLVRILVLIVGVGLVCIAAGLGFQMKQTAATTDTQTSDAPPAFGDMVGRPITVAIVGTAQDEAALRSFIKASDPDGRVDTETVPSSLADADAVVFLLDDWSDIAAAPWQDELQSDYARVLQRTRGQSPISITTVQGDRPFQRTYYEKNFYTEWALDCYAELFVHTVKLGQGVSFEPPARCPL